MISPRTGATAAAIFLATLMSTSGCLAATSSVFSPGVISGPADDAASVFTPDGRDVYFFRANGSDYDIMTSHLGVHGWSRPVIASFSGRWRDLEPAMAPDGTYMIFASSRPAARDGDRPIDGSWSGRNYPGKGGNLWQVNRKGSGWSAPVRLPDVINSSNAVFSPSIAADGTLYFMKAAGEGNHFRLFCSRLRNGHYETPTPLPFTTGQYGGADPTVAPDQSFMVFASNRPPTPSGQEELFIVFRKHGKWGEPVALPEAINRYSPITEARLGPDGHTLYFSSPYVVPTVYPVNATSAAHELERMMSWNNGNMNIWRGDLQPYLSIEAYVSSVTNAPRSEAQ